MIKSAIGGKACSTEKHKAEEQKASLESKERSSNSRVRPSIDVKSFKSNTGSQLSQNALTMVKYLCDLVDSIIDQICQRVPSIPLTIRAFCKAIVDKNQDIYQSQKMMAKLVIRDWLARIAFKDTVLYGLVKSYNIKNNSDRNIQLMGIILNKMFELDSSHFEEEVLSPFNALFD